MSAIDLEFTKFCMVSSKGYGLDNLSAKLSSILYLEPIEISIEELAKRTGYSLASISNKMKILESFGMVRRVKNPGSKKLYYYMEKDLVKLTRMHFEKIYTSEIIPAKKCYLKLLKNLKIKI